MNHNIKSIRTFIGAKNYNLSRQFYLDFGFEEIKIPIKKCLILNAANSAFIYKMLT